MTWLGYWAGGGPAAAVCSGAVAWVVLAFLSLMNQVNGLQRMTVPSARRTIAIGGDVLWDVVPHLAGGAAVFLAGAGAGLRADHRHGGAPVSAHVQQGCGMRQGSHSTDRWALRCVGTARADWR